MTNHSNRPSGHVADRRGLYAPLAAVWLVAAAALAAVGCWLLLPLATTARLIQEGAEIETATALLYGAVAIGMWAMRRKTDSLWSWLAVCWILVMFGARELDLHKAFTDISILKSRFYVDPHPLGQKLAGILVIALFAAAVLRLVVAHRHWFMAAMRARSAPAITLLCFVGVLVFTKLLDRSVDNIAQWGFTQSESSIVLRGALEEILEMMLPVLAWLGLLQRDTPTMPVRRG